jgi:type IV secretory pathway protease TraF
MPQFPYGKFTAGPEEVWLIATRNPRSFDSRYFGPVPVTALEGAAERIRMTGSNR